MVSNQALFRSLRDTRVTVIHPDDEDGRALRSQLTRIGCRVELLWPPPPLLPAKSDVVFYLVDPTCEGAHPWMSQPHHAVLIGVIGYENPVVLESLAAANVHAVTTKPIRPFGILANLFIARTLYKYEERLIARVQKLDEMLKNRRVVERATRILAERYSITEDQAYAAMRSEAMEKQQSVSAMAEAIVNAEGIFGRIKG